jgi:hypothetical protein
MTKKPRKKQPVSHETLEVATPERLKHAGDATIERRIESGRVVLRMADGDILSYLSGRGVINAEQLQCGERFYRDWYNAGLAASGVIDPTRVVVDGGNSEPAMMRKMEAAQEWGNAIRAIGTVHSHPLTAMVLLEEPATVYAMRNTGYKDPKYARVIAYDRLKQALEALVVYYLGKSRKPRQRSFMTERAGIVPSQTDAA